MSSVAVVVTFQREVINLIWNECMFMLETDQRAIGIAFDDPFSIREAIYISYVTSPHCFTGNGRQCEKRLWEDLTLAMNFMGHLWKGVGEHGVTELHQERHSSIHYRWVMFIKRDPDGSLTTFEKILRRTDETFLFLEQPLM